MPAFRLNFQWPPLARIFHKLSKLTWANPANWHLCRGLGLLLLLLGAATSSKAQSVDVAGGTLSPAATTVTMGRNSGRLTLRSFYGTVIMFQADNGNGKGFVYVGGPAQTYTYYDLRTTTSFRAIVQTPTMVIVTSTVATVTVTAAPADEVPVPQVSESRPVSFVPTLALKISPLATQDPSASTLLLGVEYRLSPRYGIEASYGHQFTALQLTTLGLLEGRNDYTYRKLKLELRRYLLPRTSNPNQETYVSVQAFFTPERYTRYGNNYYRDAAYYSYERNFVTKDISGINLKVGSVWRVWSHWLLEGGLGLGGRYVVTQYDLLNERRATNFTNKQVNPFNQIELPGTKVTIDVELAFKVGFVFPLRRP